MPLSRTDLLTQINSTTGSNQGTGNFVSSAFTPPSGSYLLVGVFGTENSGSAPVATDLTLSASPALSFTALDRIVVGASFGTYLGVFAVPIVTGVSTTLTVSFAGRTMSAVGVAVAAWTGYNTGTPIGTRGSNSQNGGFAGPPTPFNANLSVAPAATSEVWAMVGTDKSTASVTPGTSAGYTEIGDLFNPSAINGGFEHQFRDASTSTTVLWDDLRPGGGALFNALALAYEIQAQTEADLAVNLTATGSMAVTLANETHLAESMTATGSMTVALGPNETHLAESMTATGGLSATLTVTSVSGPQDPIGVPVAEQLLACLTTQLNELPKPPANIQLRVGQETGPLIGENVDECCAGLAWIRIANIYPSWDSFPAPDNTWLPCGPLAYAVVLEMGVAFCMPWSDSDDSFENRDPPNATDWANAFNTQMQHQTLMRRAAACCFRPTQRRAVGEWTPLPVEAGCTGGKLLVTVSVPAPCADC